MKEANNKHLKETGLTSLPLQNINLGYYDITEANKEEELGGGGGEAGIKGKKGKKADRKA